MVHKDHYRNGKKLVSVTELTSLIAKPFLDKWKEGLCCPPEGICGFDKGRQIAEEAADLGNKVHEEVALFLQGKLEEPKPFQDWAVKIIDIYQANEAKPYLIEPEETLIDQDSGLAGSPDAVLQYNGENVIADIKIKNSLDKLTGMQGYGYLYLLERKFGPTGIKRMLVMWAQKKSVNKAVKPVFIELEEWRKPWLALVELWNTCNPSRKVNIFE